MSILVAKSTTQKHETAPLLWTVGTSSTSTGILDLLGGTGVVAHHFVCIAITATAGQLQVIAFDLANVEEIIQRLITSGQAELTC